MRRFLPWLICLTSLIAAPLFNSCSDTSIDEQPTQEKGLYSVKLSASEVDKFGGEITLTFLAMGDWSILSNAGWCTPSIDAGESGDVELTIAIAPNPKENNERTAKLIISIDGYQSNQELCTIEQVDNIEEEVVVGNDVNRWMSDYMRDKYLWNTEFNKIKSKLNYYDTPQTFLSTALSKMQNIDEDGNYYPNGERYYYTNLSSNDPSSRAGSGKSGYGITMLYPVGATTTSYYLLIASVTKGSPADLAGLRRGMYITSYNGASITGAVLEEAYYKLMDTYPTNDMVKLELAEYNSAGTKLEPLESVSLNPATFTADPIIFEGIYQDKTKKHTIGHMVYSEFNTAADNLLIDSFEKFKSHNITDLILDLRYNGGGDVYSSTVMASAIAGKRHKGDVYCDMQFNPYRTACGEKGVFYIGKDPSMTEYPLIEQAMNIDLGLERLYVICTGFTASASELVINGLRGLDMEVFLIGETTEGKNVGMEVISSASPQYKNYDFGDYQYQFAPITFYNLNAKGFKEFENGFEVDCAHTETKYIINDWDKGTDFCTNTAIEHIVTGRWLASKSSESSLNPIVKVISNSHLRPASRGSYIFTK